MANDCFLFQINSIVKVTVRTAVPLSQTEGVSPADKVFSRAVSIFRHLEHHNCCQFQYMCCCLFFVRAPHSALVPLVQVFVMDYRDSDLFHVLEDLLRKQNAWKLGLVQPSASKPAVEPDTALVLSSSCSAGGASADGGEGAPGDQVRWGMRRQWDPPQCPELDLDGCDDLSAAHFFYRS